MMNLNTLRKMAMVWLLSLSCCLTAQADDMREAVRWMRARAIPLKTVKAGMGFDDLQPLRKVVGDARLVALGEATHGTREMFQLKHRLVEFLVEQMDFNLFLLEAPFATCFALNDYILHGKGDPAAALHAQGFWMWDTAEVLALVEWMRQHNAKPKTKRKLALYGIDAKFEWLSLVAAFQYLEAHIPVQAAELRRPLAKLFNPREFYPEYMKMPPEQRVGVEKEVERVTQAFDERRADLIAGSSESEWQTARQHTVVVWQALRFSREIFGDKQALPNSDEITLKYRVGHSARQVEKFLQRYEAAWLRSHRSFLRFFSGNFRDVEHAYRAGMNDVQRTALEQSAAQLLAHLDARQEALRAASTAEDWANAKRYANDLAQWLQALRASLTQPKVEKVVRDRAMAENAEWALTRAGANAKAILWAHNAHVAREPISIFEDDTLAGALDRRFGKSLVTFGFSFASGSFRAEYYALPSATPAAGSRPELRAFNVGTSQGAIDRALAAVRLPQFALDLRPHPRTGAAGRWFARRHKMRQFGSGFNETWEPQSYENVRLSRSFDVMLFLQSTTPTTLNPLTLKKYAKASP